MSKIYSQDYEIPGLPVVIDIAASVLSLDISVNVWISLARYIVRGLKNVRNVVVYFYQVKEYIVIEAEKSKARVQSASLHEVALIYEKRIRMVSSESMLTEATRQKVLIGLDKMMDRHFDQIIYAG